MADVDVLVPHADAVRAAHALLDAGWSRAASDLDHLSIGDFAARKHALQLDKPGRAACDLHWRVAPAFTVADGACSNGEFWSRSEPLLVEGVATRMLAPADQLLHTCVHGGLSGTSAQLRWAADACYIIRESGAALSWEHFLESAARHHQLLAARDALRYLAQEIGVPVPESVVGALADVRPGWRERRAYEVTFDARPRRHLPWWVPRAIRAYARDTAGWPATRVARDLPAYLWRRQRARATRPS
jgi:hypothetical protein